MRPLTGNDVWFIGDLVEYAEGQGAAGSGLIGVVISEQEFIDRGGEPYEGFLYVRFPGVIDMPGPPEIDSGPEECFVRYEQPSWSGAFQDGSEESDGDYESVTISLTISSFNS